MKLRIAFFLGLFVLGLGACVQDRTCSCSDGNRFTIRAQKKDASKVCNVYSNDSISCAIGN